VVLAGARNAVAAGMCPLIAPESRCRDGTPPMRGACSRGWTRTTNLPGIGPHSEPKTIELVVAALVDVGEGLPELGTEVDYPGGSEHCDVVIHGQWAIEVKLLRMLHNNGKPNDTMIGNILSRHSGSAVTDCNKLATSGFTERRAVFIIGYEYEDYPLQPVIESFEFMVSRCQVLGPRVQADFDGLVHPHHMHGRVMAREVS
jgi:hypothetical protein